MVVMKLLVVPLVSTLVVVAACQGGEEPAKPLCDPQGATSGRVSLEVRTDPSRLTRGLTTLYDNGHSYLFVDQQCNYWVNDPSEIWENTHTGVLDAETAATLGARLHFGAWPDLAGLWSDPAGGIFDAPILVFDDANEAVLCAQLCDAPDVPDAVKSMRDELPNVMQELWDRGDVLESGLRVIVIPLDSYPYPGVPYVDWPLARPISDFVRTDDAGFGQGILETDPASVQKLEQLRRSFLRGDHGAFVWDMLPITANGAYYALYIRDALPFEDANGLVPLTVDLDSL